jgi:pimeloyl-ACP methyl ester carboxylesterase
VRYPERARALFVEMPVLDNALPAVAGAFTPVLLGLRYGKPAFELVSRAASLLPRTNFMLDIGLDWVRQRPGPSGAVLEGLLLGETAPHREKRQLIEQPTLIVGHPRDPLHPFSDSGMLAEELPNARLVEASSIFEWRLKPERLTGELAAFLAEVSDLQRGPEGAVVG